MSRRIDALVVVVPAHNEEELLASCLASLEIATLAARGVVERIEVVVVLDACTDGSGEIARAAGVRVVETDARSVGVARAAGVAAGLGELVDVGHRHVWTAHTDADSSVPPHWLTHQLALARRGAHAVVGTVRPNFDDLSPEQTEAWWATHTPGTANGHVHGANLGLRADVLLRAGGFPGIPAHEDVRLMDRVRSAGARVVASDAAWVRTSGRAQGRAPEGYARYLREDLTAAVAAEAQLPREISLL